MSDAEPPSKEELARFAQEWKKRRLESTIVSMILDDEFAREVCEWIAENDNFYKAIVEARNKNKKRGRAKVWTDAAHIVLLNEYAASVLSGKNQGSLQNMVNTPGVKLSDDTIDNEISKAINKYKTGVITLPDWALPVIENRIDRGAKTRPHKNNERKNKSSK